MGISYKGGGWGGGKTARAELRRIISENKRPPRSPRQPFLTWPAARSSELIGGVLGSGKAGGLSYGAGPSSDVTPKGVSKVTLLLRRWARSAPLLGAPWSLALDLEVRVALHFLCVVTGCGQLLPLAALGPRISPFLSPLHFFLLDSLPI